MSVYISDQDVENVINTRDPAFTTDVFDYLMGDGFVMVGTKGVDAPSTPLRMPRDVDQSTADDGARSWPGIADEVKDLERLLR